MKVLFIGKNFGNSYLQFLTLKKLYKNVDKIDPTESIVRYKLFTHIFYKISPRIFEPFLMRYIISKIKQNYDLIYVNSAEFIGKSTIIYLKKISKKIIFNCNDNPFVSRDNKRWILFLSAAKHYDLIVFQHKSRLTLSKKFGLKNTLLTLPPYDEYGHRPTKKKIKKNIKVIFVGTWFPERGFFFLKLIQLGLDIKIFGVRWDKDPNYKLIKSKIKLGHVDYKKYTRLIQRSEIAISLFSKGNVDVITNRVPEITAIGTFLCSESTPFMKKNYLENKEVVYFNTPKECFNKCNYYLKNKTLQKKIANRGKTKTTKILKISNYQLIKKMVEIVFQKK